MAPEALRLISRFAQEIGPVAAAGLAASVMAERLRPAARRVRHAEAAGEPRIR